MSKDSPNNNKQKEDSKEELETKNPPPAQGGHSKAELAKTGKPKTFWKYFFIILITFILSSLITLALLTFYIYKQNPFNIQACLISSVLNASKIAEPNSSQSSTGSETTKTSPPVDHPLLSNTQEIMLEDAGIDIGTLPTTLSPEMEACGVETLGRERVNELINGATPGPLDILRAKSCL